MGRHVVDLTAMASGDQHVAVPERVGERCDADLLTEITGHATVHRLRLRRLPVDPANVAAAAGLRRLVTALRPDVVHGHSSAGGALARAMTPRSVPVVHTPHAVATGRAAVTVERLLDRRSAATVAVSDGEAEQLQTLGLGRRRLVTIPNPVRTVEPVDLRRVFGLPSDALVVANMARLAPQKDPLGWLEVASQVAAAHDGVFFVWLGDGPLRAALLGRAGVLGLGSRLVVAGHRTDAAALVATADVFLSASAYEAMPYAPLEAMASGVPAVLSDVVGHRDLAGPGCQVRPVAELAAAVGALLTDADARRGAGAAAHTSMAPRRDLAAWGARYDVLYASITG